MGDFAGKVVLISGGSRGIGRACAVEFGRRGARVLVGYGSNEAAARETVALVEAQGGCAEPLAVEVSDAEACRRAVERAADGYGRLDVLVNNAGIAVDGLLARVKPEDWHRQFAVNVDGAFFLARAACRPMMRQRSGSIVNLTSVIGESGNAGQSAYAATKAALIGFTKSLARELASRSIRVNAVAPGFIETDMTRGIGEEARARMAESIPLGRLGQAVEVARAVVFLAGDEASYITGEVLRVNGGLLM